MQSYFLQIWQMGLDYFLKSPYFQNLMAIIYMSVS